MCTHVGHAAERFSMSAAWARQAISLLLARPLRSQGLDLAITINRSSRLQLVTCMFKPQDVVRRQIKHDLYLCLWVMVSLLASKRACVTFEQCRCLALPDNAPGCTV